MVAHEREMFGSQRGVTGTEEPQGGGDRVRLSVSEYLHALEDVNNNNNNNNDDDDDDDDDNDDDSSEVSSLGVSVEDDAAPAEPPLQPHLVYRGARRREPRRHVRHPEQALPAPQNRRERPHASAGGA